MGCVWRAAPFLAKRASVAGWVVKATVDLSPDDRDSRLSTGKSSKEMLGNQARSGRQTSRTGAKLALR